jgi:1-acyl-sn-glycerol-3-phosphate acyltransferase
VTVSPSTLPWGQWVFYVTCRWCWRTLFALLGGLTVRGLENLPVRGPVILAPNHVGLLDPWIMCAASPNPLRSMAAEYLYRVPLLGAYLYGMGAFPLKQGVPDAEAMGTARRLLAQGATLMVFPEGGCSRDGLPRPWQPGVAVLALRSGAPVVPVVIEGSRRMLPLGRWLPRWSPLTVTFLEPVPAPLRDGSVKVLVQGHLERLQAAWLRGYPG